MNTPAVISLCLISFALGGLFRGWALARKQRDEWEWTDWRPGFRPAEEHRTGIYAEAASRSDPPA
jgi:hypothetical protein